MNDTNLTHDTEWEPKEENLHWYEGYGSQSKVKKEEKSTVLWRYWTQKHKTAHGNRTKRKKIFINTKVILYKAKKHSIHIKE